MNKDSPLISSSPQIHVPRTTQSLMAWVLIGLFPAAVWGGIIFGGYAVLMLGVSTVSAFASLLGISLAVAAKRLRVETDKDVEEIANLLPGLNCGICGFAGCESYAQALSSAEEDSEGNSPDVTLCSPVDAIETLPNGLVRVDEETCISCGKCAAICPTGVMKMVPAEAPWFVACNSRDSAKATKSLCSAGCIGCKICEKKFPDAGFFVQDNLSEMNYNESLGSTADAVASACSPKCIIKVGNDA